MIVRIGMYIAMALLCLGCASDGGEVTKVGNLQTYQGVLYGDPADAKSKWTFVRQGTSAPIEVDISRVKPYAKALMGQPVTASGRLVARRTGNMEIATFRLEQILPAGEKEVKFDPTGTGAQ